MKHLPTIVSDIIPHELQAYDTTGDYSEHPARWNVRVSQLPDWRYEALVMIHELTEMLLTKNNNVDWKKIDLFDTEGEGANHPDPGTLQSAPYHSEHMAATKIEKQLAKMLGVNWKKYNKALDRLEWRKTNA